MSPCARRGPLRAWPTAIEHSADSRADGNRPFRPHLVKSVTPSARKDCRASSPRSATLDTMRPSLQRRERGEPAWAKKPSRTLQRTSGIWGSRICWGSRPSRRAPQARVPSSSYCAPLRRRSRHSRNACRASSDCSYTSWNAGKQNARSTACASASSRPSSRPTHCSRRCASTTPGHAARTPSRMTGPPLPARHKARRLRRPRPRRLGSPGDQIPHRSHQARPLFRQHRAQRSRRPNRRRRQLRRPRHRNLSDGTSTICCPVLDRQGPSLHHDSGPPLAHPIRDRRPLPQRDPAHRPLLHRGPAHRRRRPPQRERACLHLRALRHRPYGSHRYWCSRHPRHTIGRSRPRRRDLP
jgi:hypothetical protein